MSRSRLGRRGRARSHERGIIQRPRMLNSHVKTPYKVLVEAK